MGWYEEFQTKMKAEMQMIILQKVKYKGEIVEGYVEKISPDNIVRFCKIGSIESILFNLKEAKFCD